ncbi:hypothetical protein EVAR_16081_1 [Eumeta japonica]|uniref:Secreted protein n=1 Tax=Eumeta variegata TaxID=151549 RepID=A0A4C1UJ91_EUMVA|nr:hypothetical protein EVAR_16081_1 [Eumeta japonica]
MLTFLFAAWAAARALGWAREAARTPAEEPPALPRLRSARASSDLSTLSAATTTSSSSTSHTSSGEPPRSAARGRPIIVEWERRKAFGGLSLVR